MDALLTNCAVETMPHGERAGWPDSEGRAESRTVGPTLGVVPAEVPVCVQDLV